MNCNICGKPILLVPSAIERAQRFGGTAASYTALFPTHSSCTLDKRRADTSAMMARSDELKEQIAAQREAINHLPWIVK